MIKIITVKLEGRKVTISPPGCDMPHGRHDIEWRLEDDSRNYDFDIPPVSFDDPRAPIINISPNDKFATCTDVNQNETPGGISYGYHVFLKDTAGHTITYPAYEDPKSDGDPYIHNRPK